MCQFPTSKFRTYKHDLHSYKWKHSKHNISVPCGKCPECTMQRANQWAFRLDVELEKSPSVAFVTLTYDELTVPYVHPISPYTKRDNFRTVVPWARRIAGPHKRLTLNKKHLQNYFKLLRFHSKIKGLKYYACGEYGSQRNRPHYHFMIYNLPESKWHLLRSCWNGSIVDIQKPRNANKANFYCLKYFHKRINKYSNGVQPEFAAMSKGLGSAYLTDRVIRYHKSAVEHCYCVKLGGYKISMPRYYKDKIYNLEEKIAVSKYLQDRSDQMEKLAQKAVLQANPILSEEKVLSLMELRHRVKTLRPILELY